MPFDPFRGFKIASDVASKVTDPYLEQQKEQRQYNNSINLEREKAKIKQEYASSGGNTNVYSFDPFSGEMSKLDSVPKGSIVRNTRNTLQESNQAAIERKQAMGAGGESGRIALAKESINNINDIKKMLFPDGTPESFKRGIASEANIFGGFSQEAQDVFRKTGASLAARQLIQTGVAARPEETEALRRQFASNFKSNPHAAFNGLNELQAFYNNYLGVADPSGMFHQGSELAQPGSSGQPPVASQGGTDMEAIKQKLRSRYYGK